MEPTSTNSLLAQEIEASRARIKQRRRGASVPTPTREVLTRGGKVDVRVDGPSAGVKAPITRAERLQNFVKQLQSTDQTEVAPLPVNKLQNKVASSPAPAPKLRNKVVSRNIEPTVGRAGRPDYSSPAGQAIAKKENEEIAVAIAALDASRQRYSQQVSAKKLQPEHETLADRDAFAATKDELVASISAAIATVLTDVKIESPIAVVDSSRADVAFAEPEPEPVQAVLAPPKPAPAPTPIVVPAPPAKKPEVAETAEVVSKPEGLQQVDPSVFNVGAYIPIDAAAWDVDEFFWPEIVDQFLDIGEQAISRLATFSIDILDGSAGRLAVCGARSDRGATTIACSIAKWSAKMKKRVLLVDANLKNPALAKTIGLSPNISWLNVVRESLDVSEAIIRCKSTGVCVMPLGEITDRSVMGPKMLDHLGKLLKSVEKTFDLVIIDAGVAGRIPAELSNSQGLIDAAMIVDSNVTSSRFRKTKDGLLKFGISKFVAAQNSI